MLYRNRNTLKIGNAMTKHMKILLAALCLLVPVAVVASDKQNPIVNRLEIDFAHASELCESVRIGDREAIDWVANQYEENFQEIITRVSCSGLSAPLRLAFLSGKERSWRYLLDKYKIDINAIDPLDQSNTLDFLVKRINEIINNPSPNEELLINYVRVKNIIIREYGAKHSTGWVVYNPTARTK